MIVDKNLIESIINTTTNHDFKLKPDLTHEDYLQIFEALTFSREHKINAFDKHERFNEFDKKWDIQSPILNDSFYQTQTNDSNFRVLFTHDVDWINVFELNSIYKSARSLISRGKNFWIKPTSLFDKNIFIKSTQQLLSLENKYGINAYYFMMAGPYSSSRFGTRYSINDPRAVDYVKMVQTNGGVIGLHGSYHAKGQNSYKLEADLISNVAKHKVNSHRNHYLRIDTKLIASQLEAAGISYDFSSGYANEYGFRNGIANPFKYFDWENDKVSDVISIPLVFMERPFHLKKSDEVLRDFEEKIAKVKKYNGCVSVLIHPENFAAQPMWWSFYEELIQIVKKLGANTNPFEDA